MKKPRMTAAELMAELNQNPEFVARQRELEERTRRNVEEYREAAAPLLDELAAAGFVVQSVSELHQRRFNYERAVPTLLKWLPLMSNPRVKESIVRALSVPFAQQAAPLLIEEFRRVDAEQGGEQAGLKWAVGNALDVVASDDVIEAMVDLATDKRHGKAREMVVSGLGNMTDRRVVSCRADPDRAPPRRRGPRQCNGGAGEARRAFRSSEHRAILEAPEGVGAEGSKEGDREDRQGRRPSALSGLR